MSYSPITPFRRTLDAIRLEHVDRFSGDLPCPRVDKWQVLRDLATGREAYGLSHRDITVLQALISFHPSSTLEIEHHPLVVHPANRTICERLNGMPCSTMRRHVAKLVEAGVILRRDSPNGKRYTRHYGATKVAYGFDLSPLMHRAAEFRDAAEAARENQARLRQQREVVSLLRRDLESLSVHGAAAVPEAENWDAHLDLAQLSARQLRRKLSLSELVEMETRLRAAITVVRKAVGSPRTGEMSTCNAQNEQHLTETKKDNYESERSLTAPAVKREHSTHAARSAGTDKPTAPVPTPLPLRLVLSNCTEIRAFTEKPIVDWHEFLKLMDFIRPMMGITDEIWSEAKSVMGAVTSSVLLAAMLERFAEIRSPNAYVRALCGRALSGEFSVARMVSALGRRSTA
ncbi:plasmid replication protein RepC [Tranquillimonas alkanivorans]|uniref:Replication initiation protein RepC n=1 Tax=Tranquillimonas alkanivorans TaxID=441119 RepID=A0A1I5VTT8_9RHOB|nr:plasmid replication protein RepC [Tranquillimonas alkanivorans]SFQ10697.1 replication initiation protein RepC [Tranquillimonas alkanivorans]